MTHRKARTIADIVIIHNSILISKINRFEKSSLFFSFLFPKIFIALDYRISKEQS